MKATHIIEWLATNSLNDKKLKPLYRKISHITGTVGITLIGVLMVITFHIFDNGAEPLTEVNEIIALLCIILFIGIPILCTLMILSLMLSHGVLALCFLFFGKISKHEAIELAKLRRYQNDWNDTTFD